MTLLAYLLSLWRGRARHSESASFSGHTSDQSRFAGTVYERARFSGHTGDAPRFVGTVSDRPSARN